MILSLEPYQALPDGKTFEMEYTYAKTAPSQLWMSGHKPSHPQIYAGTKKCLFTVTLDKLQCNINLSRI